MTTNVNEDNARVQKISHFKTTLCKRFVSGFKLTNIFQLPKVKAQEPGTDNHNGTTDYDNNDKDVNQNKSAIFSGPSFSSINTEEIKTHPSKRNIINGVDISQFISENEVQEYLKNETGRDRLLEMFSKNDLNQYSSQVKFIGSVVGEVAVVSCFLFSYKFGRSSAEDFKRENRGTLYGTRYLAKRRFNDNMVLKSTKHGLRWSFKISSFTALYLLLSQSISTYRNKTSPLEYGMAGAITGGFFRMNMGPRGMCAGALIAGPVGLLLGTLASGFFFIFNSTQEQRHYCAIQTQLFEKKENQGNLPPLPPSTTTSIKTGYGGES